jgi:hypothetical protein
LDPNNARTRLLALKGFLKNPISSTHQLVCSKVDTCPPLVGCYCPISDLFLLPWKKDAPDVRGLRIMMKQFHG